MPPPPVIVCNDSQRLPEAQALADSLRSPLHMNCEPRALDDTHPVALVFDVNGLYLQACGKRAPGPVTIDFVAGRLGYRRRSTGEGYPDIARAVGLKKSRSLSVLDVTAGLGQDGFMLAHWGCSVTLVERNPVIIALLRDGLKRASDYVQREKKEQQEGPRLNETLQRLSVVFRDSALYLRELEPSQQVDVIYLDPMFPERDKSAKVKKNMQVFHALIGDDADAGELLELALQKARYRVVVKRPLRADYLADRKPSAQIEGRSVRFDIYPLKKPDEKTD